MLELAGKQHGAVSRQQLLAIGLSGKAIKHAVAAGQLYRTEWRGVYAVGRPELTKHGRLRAALLASGDHATLVDDTAGALWGFWKPRDRQIHLSLPAESGPRLRSGVTVHRRRLRPGEITHHWGLPVTTPLRTVIDLAAACDRPRAERLINAADAANLVRADTLAEELHRYDGRPGVPLLRSIFSADGFVLTESEAERLFVPLARRAGLGKPQSQRRFGRHRVDFYFPEHNLVVECDGLRYHRTTIEQREDLARDQAHLLAGRERVRFTYDQLAHDPDYVVAALTRIRLRGYTRGR